MNILKSGRILAGVAVSTLLTSQAFAGNCRTLDRNFPSSGGQDAIQLECQRNAAANASAIVFTTNTGGTKTTRANLLTGTGQTATVFGLDINGTTVASCTATDTTPGGSAGTPQDCAGGAKWRGQLTFAE